MFEQVQSGVAVIVIVSGGLVVAGLSLVIATGAAYFAVLFAWERLMRIRGLIGSYRQARLYKYLFITWAEKTWASGATHEGGRRIDRAELAAFLRTVNPDKAHEYGTPDEIVAHAVRDDEDA